MTEETIIKDLLDCINRPAEEPIWLQRATNAVADAIVRLFQKFNFEVFRGVIDVTVPEDQKYFSVADRLQVVNAVYRVSSLTEVNAKTEPVSIVDSISANIDMRNIEHYHIPHDCVVKYGLSFWTSPRKFYKIDGYYNLTEAQKSPLYEDEFLLHARDFILYDAWTRLSLLLNDDVDKLASVKTLRDEAYNDLINWNDKFSLKGPIDIKG